MAARDLTLDQTLPDNLDAERFVLGAVMSSENAFLQVAGTLAPEDFSLEKHKRIFLRMVDLHERGEKIDRVTVANELMKHGQLQSVDGLSYLVSLDDGLPRIYNLDSYVTIVKEKSLLRRIISVSQDTINRCLTCEEDATQILGAVEDALMKLGDVQSKNTLSNPAQIVSEFEGGINAFLDTSKRIKGISTGFLKFDEMTGGLREGELFVLAARPAMGKCLAADSEIVLADGRVKTIADIVRDQRAELLTLNNQGKLQTAYASAFVDDGVKPVFRVTTRLGRSVICTLPHPLLTFNGWRALADLGPGDTIAVPRHIPFSGSTKVAQQQAKLLAYLLGDGGLTDNVPKFTNSNPVLRNEFINCLSWFGDLTYRIDAHNGRTPTIVVTANRAVIIRRRAAFAKALAATLVSGRSDRNIAISIGVSPANFVSWRKGLCVPSRRTLQKLVRVLGVSVDDLLNDGLESAYKNGKNSLTRWLVSLDLMGKSASQKSIPAAIFSCDRQTIALFLSRLFATDGWASVQSDGQSQIGYSTVSERLARQVQHLLLRFGIIGSLRHRNILYNGTRRPSWQLEITHVESLDRFIKEIGIFGKETAVEMVASSLDIKKAHSNRDLIPDEVWPLIASEKGALSWGELARHIGIKAVGPNMHVGKRALSRRRLLKIADAISSDALRAIATSDIYWDRIVSIEPLGPQQVYDLTIPETHNFIANDICVHNTALALNIAQHVATNKANPKAVAVFSLEMSKESLLTRMLCAAARVDQQRFRAGYLNADERRALQESMYEMVEAPLFIDDTAGTNLMDVHAKLRRLQADHDLGLVVIDYLQLMQGRGRFENRVQEISSLSRGFKLMSKELRVPFLVLSQLSRAPETRPGDHRPMLSDLRESGSIEQDADMVGFIFREEVYRPDKESLKGIAELILAKQRNGPTGRVKLAFLNRYTKFENLATDTGDDEAPYE